MKELTLKNYILTINEENGNVSSIKNGDNVLNLKGSLWQIETGG